MFFVFFRAWWLYVFKTRDIQPRIENLSLGRLQDGILLYQYKCVRTRAGVRPHPPRHRAAVRQETDTTDSPSGRRTSPSVHHAGGLECPFISTRAPRHARTGASQGQGVPSSDPVAEPFIQ